MAKFAQYYLKYNLEHMFSTEYKDERQQIFGAFFETNVAMRLLVPSIMYWVLILRAIKTSWGYF